MRTRISDPSLSRRRFARQLLQAAAGIVAAPASVRASVAAASVKSSSGPAVTHGVASGDVSFRSGIVWSRCERQARMVVEWSTSERFRDVRRVVGPLALEENDFTARFRLPGLPPGQRIFYRVHFEDRDGTEGRPVSGQFVTAPRDRRDVLFAWSGDTCGQGYGIDRARGGLLTYAGMRSIRPDFFIHSGDTIYADGPLEAEKKLPDGTVWRNLVTEAKSKVAETLAEFRGNHRYNLMDDNVRGFNSEVALFGQWDDHEVRNNWYPGQVLEDGRYTIKDVDQLAQNGSRAFRDYWPVNPARTGRVFRRIARGPLCDVFMIDLRSYRGPNSANRQVEPGPETAFLGENQLHWLKKGLFESQATWKVIASDMPIGIVVKDGAKTFENGANGNGPARGRELEIADLLGFLKRERIRNVIWLTADVHYAASNLYDPSRAQFTEFDPFWEFVSGPLHAASLSPGSYDNTFGPELKWSSRPRGAAASGPYTKEQFFSTVWIQGGTGTAVVTHRNRDGEPLWKVELPAT